MLRCGINSFMNYAPFVKRVHMYVVDAHFIDKIEKKNIYPGPKCLWSQAVNVIVKKSKFSWELEAPEPQLYMYP